MKKILVRVALLFSVLSSSNSYADSIKGIDIVGINAIPKETVLSYLPIEVGDDFNNAVSNQIIKTLYKTQFFYDIEVIESNQIVTITVTERPHIKYVEVLNYSDNEVLSDKSIQETLEAMNLTTGTIFDKRQLQSLTDQLRELYISKGYYNINIKSSVEVDAHNRVGVEIDITEGEVARINSMKIHGSKTHTEGELLDLFDIGEADFWILNYFTKKDHFSKELLDSGVQSMTSLYINSGYLDFNVDEVKTILSDDNSKIDVVINIHEGSIFKLGNVNFTGELLNHSQKDLINMLGLSKDDVFERANLIAGIETVTDNFGDQGYAFTNTEPVTTHSQKDGYIDLNINITTNKKIYINRITITGNTRTQDDVIRREIGISEGGIYSKSELDNSVTKIKRLGFFSDVQMQINKVNDYDDKINLHFNLVETKTGSFTAGVSHSNETGASFNVGITEKNILGTGNVLNAKLTSSQALKEVSFYFSDPYFNEDKHSISYGFFNKKLDASKVDKEAYKINETGASLGYGIPLTDTTNLKSEIAFSKRDITCGSTFAGSGYEQSQCASTDKYEVKANLNWSDNSLDNYLYPTEGSRNFVNMDLSLPLGDFKYYKIDASHKSYYPIGNDVTFAIKGGAGIAGGYGGKNLPFFKRYYSGGSGSVRGFNLNSLGTTYANGKPKGGEVSLFSSASVISPMKFIDNSENMRMSAFVDAGSVNEKASNIDLGEVRMSTGVAFYWMTPIGPLGLYAAKPVIKKAGDLTTTLQFTIGSSF